jgi:hypothetical protein
MPSLSHNITIAAPVASVYDLVADVSQTVRLSPTVIHIERLEGDSRQDVIQRWVLDNGSIRTWQVTRSLDPAAGLISFGHQQAGTRGSWSFQARGTDTLVELTHEVPDADIAARLEKGVVRQLAGLKWFAEQRAVLDSLEFVHTDVTSGRIEDFDSQIRGQIHSGRCYVRVGQSVYWKHTGELPAAYRQIRGEMVFDGTRVTSRRVDCLDPAAVAGRSSADIQSLVRL